MNQVSASAKELLTLFYYRSKCSREKKLNRAIRRFTRSRIKTYRAIPSLELLQLLAYTDRGVTRASISLHNSRYLRVAGGPVNPH